MNIAAHRAIGQRYESLTKKHITQTEAKKPAILVDTSVAECRQVQRTRNEGFGKDRHAIVYISRGILSQQNFHRLQGDL